MGALVTASSLLSPCELLMDDLQRQSSREVLETIMAVVAKDVPDRKEFKILGSGLKVLIVLIVSLVYLNLRQPGAATCIAAASSPVCGVLDRHNGLRLERRLIQAIDTGIEVR